MGRGPGRLPPLIHLYLFVIPSAGGEDPRHPLGLRWRVTRRRKKGAADPAVPARKARLAVENNARRATIQVVVRIPETKGHSSACVVVILAIA